MVFTRTPPQALKVLDGQQRHSDNADDFQRNRNWLRQNNFTDAEIKINVQLLTTDDIGGPGVEPKLRLTPANNETFQKYIISASHIAEIEKAEKATPKEDRNKTLLKAALLVNRYAESKAAEFPSIPAAHDYFIELITFIRESVQVVRFVVNRDDAAYTIFETLNDRGLELSPLDLVKNSFIQSR